MICILYLGSYPPKELECGGTHGTLISNAGTNGVELVPYSVTGGNGFGNSNGPSCNVSTLMDALPSSVVSCFFLCQNESKIEIVSSSSSECHYLALQ